MMSGPPPPMTGVSTMTPAPIPPNEPSSAFMPSSSSVPDFAAFNPAPHQGPELYPGQYSSPAPETPKVQAVHDEPVYHWYYKVSEMERNVLNPT